MDTKIYHDHMVIIESLADGERLTGRELFEFLTRVPSQDRKNTKGLLRQDCLGQNSTSQFNVEYYFVNSAKEFLDFLKYARRRKDLISPLLHIEAHGGRPSKEDSITASAISFADNSELYAEEAAPYFSQLNLHSKFNLEISFALCHGFFQSSMWASAFEKGIAAPFVALNGVKNKVLPPDLFDIYTNFYPVYFSTGELKTIGGMLVQSTSHSSQMTFFDVKDLMVNFLKDLIANKLSSKEREERARTIQLRAIQMTGEFILHDTITECMSIDKHLKGKLEDHIRTFFAFDKIPHNKERFADLTFEKLLEEAFPCVIGQDSVSTTTSF